jgi:predicted helicase
MIHVIKVWKEKITMNDKETFLMNCYEKAFVIYSYDKNLHLAHLENSDMPLKDFLKAYKVKMRELTDEEVIYTP